MPSASVSRRLRLTALAVLISNPLAPAVIVVDGGCTLPDAITAANTDSAVGGCTAGSGADEIQLTADVTLTQVASTDSDGDNGLPVITSVITIEGNEWRIRRINSAPEFRILKVAPEGELALRNTTVGGGVARSSGADIGGGILNRGDLTLVDSALTANRSIEGGGAYNSGQMYLVDSAIFDNSVTAYSDFTSVRGGGIANVGSLDATNSTISNNSATASGYYGYALGAGIDDLGTLVLYGGTISDNVGTASGLDAAAVGGGVLVRGTGSVITRTTISGNEADYGGGVASWLNADATIVDSTLIENYGRFGGAAAIRSGSITFTRSTLANNSAISGGGIEVYSGESRFTNSTLSGNTASSRGGGILSYGTNHLTNSTLSGNSANEGGGIFTFTDNYVTNTLFANSLQGGNCDGYVIDLGNNLADDDTCGAIPDTLSGLDPVLADNGGPTPTHALLEGSNAIDLAGDCGLPTDQRGAPRFDGACDSGAFEFTPCPLLILSGITVDTAELFEECEIQAGPDLLVTSAGELTLRSGKTVAILDGFEVESGGGLIVEIDPDLQLTIAIEAARQAGAWPR